jgi:hypothetical protein
LEKKNRIKLLLNKKKPDIEHGIKSKKEKIGEKKTETQARSAD